MKFTLVRKIYFHSTDTGLVSKLVSKEVESEIAPQVGFEFEDSAWHRNDRTTAESISVDTETGKCTVYLNSKEVGAESDVDKFYNRATEYNGWKNWFES